MDETKSEYHKAIKQFHDSVENLFDSFCKSIYLDRLCDWLTKKLD